MNVFQKALSHFPSLNRSANLFKNGSHLTFLRSCSVESNSSKMPLEKSVNHVTLIGRVGINPQLRGSEAKPVVVFTLATNTNYKYDTGELQQKTDWHRIAVFRPNLRDIVLEHLKKGTRVYIDGRILYGEYTDDKGVFHSTASIVANDVIFLGSSLKKESFEDVAEEMS